MNRTLKYGLLSCTTLLLACLAAPAADPIKIGVAWEGKSSPPERATAAMTEALKTLAPQIEVELKKELKDVAELTEVAKKFEQEKKAMVILRSSGAKCLGKISPKIPAFIGACGDPVELGVIKNAAEPEGNITGVTQAIPYKTQFQTYLSICPKAKNVLLLLQEDHPVTALDRVGTKAACEQFKLEYSEKVCKTKDEAMAAAKEADGKVSFIVFGAEGLLIDNGGSIAAAIKTPTFSYTDKPVTDGALGGVVADQAKLGQMLAESIVDVLVKGKAVKEVGVKADPKPQLVINADTAKQIGLEIPFEILSAAKIVQK